MLMFDNNWYWKKKIIAEFVWFQIELLNTNFSDIFVLLKGERKKRKESLIIQSKTDF